MIPSALSGQEIDAETRHSGSVLLPTVATLDTQWLNKRILYLLLSHISFFVAARVLPLRQWQAAKASPDRVPKPTMHLAKCAA